MQRAPRRGAVTIFHGRDIIYQSRARCGPDMQAMFDNVVHVFKNVPTCAFSKSIEPLVHKTFNDEWFRKELHVKEDLC